MGKSKFEYYEERDKDLMDVYRYVFLTSPNGTTLNDMLSIIVEHKSKRFWVSEKRAYLIMLRLRNGDDLSSMNENKRKMYFEIYRRINQLELERHEHNLLNLVYGVLAQEAPCFYLTAGSAKVIIHYIKKRRCGSLKRYL
ncbi:MAG: hypothetical protein RR280_07450 [Bacteroidaceae bacterium]